VEVHAVVAQLTASDSSGGNKSDMAPPHDYESTKKEYYEVKIKKCCEGQNSFFCWE
jgi:hypothetical protein